MGFRQTSTKNITGARATAFSFSLKCSIAISILASLPLEASALEQSAPAEAATIPVSGKETPSRYVPQMPKSDVFRSAVQDKEKESRKEQEKLEALLGKDLANDLTMVASIEQGGWKAQAPAYFVKSGDKLVGADGKPAEELSSKSVSILLEYGLIHAVTRVYSHAQHDCNLSLFRFQNSAGAYGAYSTMREGSSTVVVRGQGSSEDQNCISFFAGNCLVILNSNSDDGEESKQLITKLADKIAPRLASAQPLTPLLNGLPHYERLNGSEKLFMGSKSANYYSNFPFIDALLLDRSRGAIYADYQYSRPMAERLRLLVAEYGNPSIAQEAFNSYTSNMSSYARKTVEKTTNELVCKMSDSYLMCGLNGPKLFVIAGARKAASPRILSRELMR